MSNYVEALGRRFYLEEEEGALVYCGVLQIKESSPNTPLIEKAKKQLEEYFRGERKVFTLPLAYKTTNFRKRVYKEIEKIPYGQVITYGEPAKRFGSTGAARAVGNTMGANKLTIFLP